MLSLQHFISMSALQAALGVSTRSTQTNWQYVSIGLQTDNLPSSRGMGLHSKAWSTRPSSTTTSSLASARSRQISTSLDKVHSRIDRPCCSPKYGSPKLQRRVSSGNWALFSGPRHPLQTLSLGRWRHLTAAFLFRIHLQTGRQSLLQGPEPVEPPAETPQRRRTLGLGSLHHHQGQPGPERPHRRPLQPLQRGRTRWKHGVAVEGGRR